ncbi:putative membrane protein [Besnoitia besnoiti]|uniref:Putative membrane protein n=1 Tax=Besnoitia besnoiti TaxID=94643 RepID=A0A2A9MJ06_BESBE|nr:putative membrane protein [Besnoitia besnoiti]PFH37955.1 putative membrane protein [Besnoitia besnoiti]
MRSLRCSATFNCPPSLDAAMALTAVSGTATLVFLTVFLLNVDADCDVPLKWWLLGCTFFSFPATYMTGLIKKYYGFEPTIWAEILILVLGFIWMGIGTIEINMSATCESTAPSMWWTVFVSPWEPSSFSLP